MQYLRDRYRAETGYSYPSENDPDEYYVEWLEGWIEEQDVAISDIKIFRTMLIDKCHTEGISSDTRRAFDDVLVAYHDYFSNSGYC